MTPRELHDASDTFTVLDVRDDHEFETEGHIEGARHMYVGYLDEHFEKIQPALPRHGRIALVCSVGHRAGLATSILRRRGFTEVTTVLGGMTAWEELGLPRRQGPERTVTTVDIEGARR